MMGQALYVRGMNMSESDDEQSWDDTKLNEAYDKALQIANAEVAKRIAMSTNSKLGKGKQKSTKKEKKTQQQVDTNIEWRSGMPCRAIYEEDGLEYEAFISRIIDDKECVVRFIGYENSEVVALESLKPSQGNAERMRQIEIALNENADDGFDSQSQCEGGEVASERVMSPGTSDQSSQQKKKVTKKKSGPKKMGMSFNNLPSLQMPNMSMFKNINLSEMPMPPPPPPISLSGDRTDGEEQAISTMLLSWYMTGYYTGLYQGMKRARDNNKQ